MDIGELTIRIQATAESLEATLNAASQKVQQFARGVEAATGRPIKLDVKTDGLTKATADMGKFANSATTASLALAKKMEVKVSVDSIKAAYKEMGTLEVEINNARSALDALEKQFAAQEINPDVSEAELEKTLQKIIEQETALDALIAKQTEAIQTVRTAATEGGEGVAEAFNSIGKGLSKNLDEAAQASQAMFATIAADAKEAAEAVGEVGEAGLSAGMQSAVGAAAATAATVVWTNVVKVLKRAMTGLIGSFLVYPIINGIKDWVASLAQAREEAEKLRQEQIKTNEESAQGHSDNAAKIREYAKEYVELRNKQRSVSEEARFLELQSELASLMGTTTDAIYAQAASLDAWAAAAESAAKSQESLALESLKSVAAAKKASAHSEVGGNYFLGIYAGPGDLEKIEERYDKFHKAYVDYMKAEMDVVRGELIAEGAKVNESFYAVIADMAQKAMEQSLGGIYLGEGKIEERADQAVADIASHMKNLLTDETFSDAISTQAGLYDRVLYGKATKEQALAEATATSKTIRDRILAMFEGIYGEGDLAKELTNQLYDLLAPLAAIEKQAGGLVQHFTDAGNGVGFMEKELDGFTSDFITSQNRIKSLVNKNIMAETARGLLETFKQMNEAGEDTEGILETLNDYGHQLGITSRLTADNIGQWSEDLKKVDGEWTSMLLSAGGDYEKFMEGLKAAQKDILEDEEITPGEESALKVINALLRDGEAAKEMFTALGEFDGILQNALTGGISPEEAAADMEPLLETIEQRAVEALIAFGMEAKEAEAKVGNFINSLTDGKGLTEFVADSVAASVAITNLDKTMQAFDKNLSRAKGTATHAKSAKDLLDSWRKLDKEMQQSPKEIEKVNRAMILLGKNFDGSTQSVEEAEKAIGDYEQSVRDDAAAMEANIADLYSQLDTLNSSADIHGTITGDSASIKAAIVEAEAKYNEFLSLPYVAWILGNQNVPSSSGGGGGGGGKNKEEEAAKEAEQRRRDALQEDYRMIEHRRRLNEISFEEELEALEKIRKKHVMNAQEIMDWEEKVYALKQEIRQRDEENLDRVANGLIEALSNRYQEMLDAEIDKLDESRKAWQDWRDDSVKAIQDQIDALDELSKTEDREKTDQEELRKIAKLKQDIEFEQDDYNRMKLQQQLDQAISSREERLVKQDRDDLKDSLREQIEAINDRADAEQEALDEEQKRIEEAYAAQMTNAALQAEAEKLLMTSTQEEIIALIGEFAPDYNALGQSLGEKLMDGFTGQVGNIVTWFQNLNDALADIQAAAAAEAVAASQALYVGSAGRQEAQTSMPRTTVVHQTNNFNEPLDSADLTAQRIKQVNEDLGRLLYS